MSSSGNFLSVEGVTKIFQNGGVAKTVMEEVTFDLAQADSLAVVGPSGCGKTTLLLMVAGLLRPTAGTIRLEGEVLARPTSKIALVLQEYGLFPWKTVGSNITLGARLQRIRIGAEALMELKRDLGIENLDHLYPDQLSGGQRQRVALARALLLRPSLLLLDEPFAAIDTITRERLQNMLLTIYRQRRFSFVIVTHNIEEAVFLGRRILVLGDGTRGIRTIFQNPGTGDADFRSTSEFFARTLELRKVLEELE